MNESKGKLSFLLYCDQLPILENLTDQQTGALIKNIYSYCGNGRKNPLIKDPAVKMAFTAIKITLDRDHDKWEKIKKVRSESGKKGGRPKESK